MEKPWVWEVPEACHRLARDLGRNKGDVERALGLVGGALTASRLGSDKGEAIVGRLVTALSPVGVFRAAQRLFVGDADRRRIERFRDDVLRHFFGVSIALHPPEATRNEAVLMGRTGTALFHVARWDAAVTYLQPAWSKLQTDIADLTEEEFALLVRVGTALDDWLIFQRQAESAARISRTLEIATAGRRSGNTDGAAAVAGFLTSAAVSYRAEGRLPPGEVLRRCHQAVDLFRALPGHEDGLIRALRDEAKPLVVWGYGWHQDPCRTDPRFPHRFEEADAALSQSEAAAGGENPRGPLRLGWLFTRLTRVECKALTGHSEEAKRQWGEAMEKPWVAGLISAQSEAPLRSKCAMTEMALLAGQGRYEALGDAATAFLNDQRNVPYADRMQRAREMVQAAETGDVVGMRRAVLR